MKPLDVHPAILDAEIADRLTESAKHEISTPDGLERLDEGSQWTTECYADVARMIRNMDGAFIELSRLPETQTRSLTGVLQAVLSLRNFCLDQAKTMLDEYDPSPWCSACGAKTSAACRCDPVDPMD